MPIDMRYLPELNGHRFDNYVDWIMITSVITLTVVPGDFDLPAASPRPACRSACSWSAGRMATATCSAGPPSRSDFTVWPEQPADRSARHARASPGPDDGAARRMSDALSLTLADLGLPAVRNAMSQAVLWTLALFVVLVLLIGWGIESAHVGAWVEAPDRRRGRHRLAGRRDGLAADRYRPTSSSVGFGFGVVAQNIAAFYFDQIVGAVEAGALSRPARGARLVDRHRHLRHAALHRRAGCVNIVAIPFYFMPVLNIVVFYVLNGYLFGREYAEAVAFRRWLRATCGPGAGPTAAPSGRRRAHHARHVDPGGERPRRFWPPPS